MAKRVFIAAIVVDEGSWQDDDVQQGVDRPFSSADIRNGIKGLKIPGIAECVVWPNVMEFADDYVTYGPTILAASSASNTDEHESVLPTLRCSLGLVREYLSDFIDDQESGISEGIYEDAGGLRAAKLHLIEYDRALNQLRMLIGHSH